MIAVDFNPITRFKGFFPDSAHSRRIDTDLGHCLSRGEYKAGSFACRRLHFTLLFVYQALKAISHTFEGNAFLDR